jgi:copper chaperone
MCVSPTTDLGLTDTNHACACNANEHSSATTANGGAHGSSISQGLVREHYEVEGMTCSHCVASVSEELSSLVGVDKIDVRLNAGGVSTVMITSSTPIPVDEVRAAIREAGYTLVTT